MRVDPRNRPRTGRFRRDARYVRTGSEVTLRRNWKVRGVRRSAAVRKHRTSTEELRLQTLYEHDRMGTYEIGTHKSFLI